MTDVVLINVDELQYPETNGLDRGHARKSVKRKRASLLENLSTEERESRIVVLNEELNGLFRYFKEVLAEKVHLNVSDCSSTNSVIACFLEESNLPFSKLVKEIYEKTKARDGVTLASVRSSVLFVGQRMLYGVHNAEADVLEDETESCLWCWETRDAKLLPKSSRGVLRIRQTCRKKIHERIIAVSDMINALKSDINQNCKIDVTKASEKLGKVLNEADIRLLVDNMVKKDGADIAEKEAKREQKLLIKQLEKSKCEDEKKKMSLDRETQKEKFQREKEQKRLQDEVEKEEKRREKEESETRRQVKRQQEELEKERRRKEKEEAEMKKQLSIKKQASIMERFLKRTKNSSPPTKGMPFDLSADKNESFSTAVPVTLSMDVAFSHKDDVNIESVCELHFASWHRLGNSIRLKRKQNWGIRRKPKTELVKALKLTTSTGTSGKAVDRDDEMSEDKIAYGLGEIIADDGPSQTNGDGSLSIAQKTRRSKQLLQFDKSYRPAFYGIWPRKSCIVGPRHPFKKDPELDYDLDSDEEWEEEDPGESLSDCDKDDEEENLEEGYIKTEEEDESEDGFFVPDGYLSENEGVQVDRAESNLLAEDFKSEPYCYNEEFHMLLRQQKHLNSLTDLALRRNRPLIILNLMHEKAPLLLAEDLRGTSKLEQTSLRTLSMCPFPGSTPVEISLPHNLIDEDQEACLSNNKGSSMAVSAVETIADSNLPEIVSAIQSCSQNISKVVECLQQTFPTISKSQLRNKVRELSEFVDNRWQVKKDVLAKLGLTTSPEKAGGRTKSIATFFSKRCLPSPGKNVNTSKN